MLDSLRHFLLVVETGTFTEAARRAHITQPGLSASIKRLEDSLGTSVLVRLPRGARPTAAGQALIPSARAALAALADGERAVADVLGLRAGEVRVGGGAIACTYLLPPVLAEFRARWPEVTVRLRETFTPDVPAAVDAGRLDLGIIEGPDAPERSDPLCEDPLVLVAAPEVAARWHDGLRLTADAPFVTFPPGASLRSALDRSFPGAELVSELTSVSAVKGFLRAGIGVGLLSLTGVRVDLELGRLVALVDPRLPPPRQLVVRHRGVQTLSPAARELRALLLQRAPRPTLHHTVDAEDPLE